MRHGQWSKILLLKHGDGLPIEAQQRATNGRPYNIACTTDNAVGASIARPLVMVLSAVRHRDGAIFSIANVGGELPLAASECLPLRLRKGKPMPWQLRCLVFSSFQIAIISDHAGEQCSPLQCCREYRLSLHSWEATALRFPPRSRNRADAKTVSVEASRRSAPHGEWAMAVGCRGCCAK